MIKLDLNKAMDVVSEDILKETSPIRSANWSGGRENRTLQAYTSTITSLAKNAADLCGGADGNMVEIGTDFGMGSFAMAYALRWHTSRKVFTFDVRRETVIDSRARAKRLGADNITFIHSTSHDVGLYGKNFSFAYIDGLHTYEGCYPDLCNIGPLMHENGLILCHDLKPANRPPVSQNGVRKAILDFIKENPEWTAMRIWGFGLLGRALK